MANWTANWTAIMGAICVTIMKKTKIKFIRITCIVFIIDGLIIMIVIMIVSFWFNINCARKLYNHDYSINVHTPKKLYLKLKRIY